MSNEIAVRSNDDYPALMALAKELCTTGFLPVAIKTPAQAVAIILTGRELGLPPMQSLRSICIIQGKPELSADLQLSIFHRDGGRSKWTTMTAIAATLWLRHPNGDEHTETWTMEDAKQAGLAAGANWQKYPKAMLRSRAITAGLKSIGFEPLTGAYAPGEIGGPEVVGPEPVEIVPEAEPSEEPPQPPAPKAKAPIKMATSNTRAAALNRLGCQEDGPAKTALHGYLVALGWLDSDKAVEQWPMRFVPISAEELEALRVGLAEFSQNGVAVRPYAPHGLDPSTIAPKPSDAPKADQAPALPSWCDFVMPFGKKGVTLGKLKPEELKYYVDQFAVKETVDVQQEDGSIVTQALSAKSIEDQKALRAALDAAKANPKG